MTLGQSISTARVRPFFPPDPAPRGNLLKPSAPCERRRTGNAAKLHRDPHSFAKKCASNPFIFKAVQKSAQPAQTHEFKLPCFHTHAHSFPGNPLRSAFYVFGRGVYRGTGVIVKQTAPISASTTNHLRTAPSPLVGRAGMRSQARALRPTMATPAPLARYAWHRFLSAVADSNHD